MQPLVGAVADLRKNLSTRWPSCAISGQHFGQSQADVEAETLCDTLRDAEAMVDKLAESEA